MGISFTTKKKIPYLTLTNNTHTFMRFSFLNDFISTVQIICSAKSNEDRISNFHQHIVNTINIPIKILKSFYILIILSGSKYEAF